MAKKYKKHHSSGFGGGKKIMGLGTKGLIGGLGILGVVGAVFFSDQIAAAIPINIPMKDKAVAFAIGGPAGLVGKFGKDMLTGSGSGGTAYY